MVTDKDKDYEEFCDYLVEKDHRYKVTDETMVICPMIRHTDANKAKKKSKKAKPQFELAK